MGKLHSKHVCKRVGPEGECFLVSTQFSTGTEQLLEASWPDICSDQSVWQKVLNNQEVSVCLKNMRPSHTLEATTDDTQLPLRVVLPPEKVSNSTAKVLTMDQEGTEKKLIDSETTDDNNRTLNVEEFECGVSVAGSDKQEWSFTLYDFDGNGKITKEDLGSLLRSLYDAVGSSINLPKSGTKTLKLRLTVSPDHSKVTGTPKEEKEKNDCQKETNNKTTKESKLNKDLDNSKLSSNKDLKLDNISKAEQLNLEGTPREVKVHHKEVKNNLSLPCKTAGKPKLTSTEQRHLAELIQKNMERHQQRQQQRQQRQHPTRRHNGDHRKHHSFSVSNNHTMQTCEESQDRRNYYLDLAGIENVTSKLHNMSAPADILSPRLGKREHGHRSRETKLRSRSHNPRTDPADCQGNHQRSKSHDVSHDVSGKNKVEMAAVEATAIRTRLIERTAEEELEKSHSPKSPPKMASTPNKNHKLRPVSLPPNVPETASPHHHRRHRNREKNRKLAMQQVAEWIEREHAWNRDEEKVVVQRHEHHHIHEHHHHHHYHHYHET